MLRPGVSLSRTDIIISNVAVNVSISKLHFLLILIEIVVFKILNGYENIDRNIFFAVKEERRTRGHGLWSYISKTADVRTFSQRTVNEWNRLSADFVGAA